MMKKSLILLSAVSGGLIFTYFKIPAGAMVGSLLGTATSQMIFNTKFNVPKAIKRSIRMIMGCYIGLGITIEGIRQSRNILGAIGIVIVGMMFATMIATYLIHKFFNLNLTEAFLSSLPAGLSEIGMNAEEFKLDPLPVTTIHLMRLITTLIFIPLIVNYLNR